VQADAQIVHCERCNIDIGGILDQGAYREAVPKATEALSELPANVEGRCDVPGCQMEECDHAHHHRCDKPCVIVYAIHA
jgi:hypothetical protein